MRGKSRAVLKPATKTHFTVLWTSPCWSDNEKVFPYARPTHSYYPRIEMALLWKTECSVRAALFKELAMPLLAWN